MLLERARIRKSMGLMISPNIPFSLISSADTMKSIFVTLIPDISWMAVLTIVAKCLGSTIRMLCFTLWLCSSPAVILCELLNLLGLNFLLCKMCVFYPSFANGIINSGSGQSSFYASDYVEGETGSVTWLSTCFASHLCSLGNNGNSIIITFSCFST